MCDFMPALLSGLRARDSGSGTASRPAGLRSQPAGLARPGGCWAIATIGPGRVSNATRQGRAMRYRSLGRSGLVVSVAGLGCNNFGRRLDVGATRAVVDAAMEAGIT